MERVGSWTSPACASCCSLQCAGWPYVPFCCPSGKMCSLGAHFLGNKENILLWTPPANTFLHPDNSSFPFPFPQLLPTSPPSQAGRRLSSSQFISNWHLAEFNLQRRRLGAFHHTDWLQKKPWILVNGRRQRQNKKINKCEAQIDPEYWQRGGTVDCDFAFWNVLLPLSLGPLCCQWRHLQPADFSLLKYSPIWSGGSDWQGAKGWKSPLHKCMYTCVRVCSCRPRIMTHLSKELPDSRTLSFEN